MVNYWWCSHDEIDVKLTFQTLLDNIHVKKAQETTTETKTKGLRRFRLKLKTGIIQLELFKSLTQVVIFIWLNRIKTSKDHWVHLLITMKWFCGWIIRKCHCITDTSIRNCLNWSCYITNISSRKVVTANSFRSENTNLSNVKGLAIRHHLNLIARFNHSVNHTHLEYDATIRIINRVKDKGLERCFHITLGRRNFLNNLFENLFDTNASLSWCKHSFRGI